MKDLVVQELGEPVLRQRARSVRKRELKSKTFQQFLDALAAVCVANLGVGIAAPQVGVSKRVIVVHVDPKNSRYPNRPGFAQTIVINPKIIRKSKVMVEEWEGDLSVDLRGQVPRAKTCVVAGLDRDANPVEYKLTEPFHARVFQHEIDHLDGRFFIDRVRREETLTTVAVWEKYWKPKP